MSSGSPMYFCVSHKFLGIAPKRLIVANKENFNLCPHYCKNIKL
jgi:hypothetical protein